MEAGRCYFNSLRLASVLPFLGLRQRHTEEQDGQDPIIDYLIGPFHTKSTQDRHGGTADV
ncbi:hypothetical protein P3T31_001689 [Rhizobium sp. AN70]|nr:hypothetical protein [Rhizobium sp. AN70]